MILYRTLRHLGLPAERIKVHLLPKGETIHAERQRSEIAALLSDQEQHQNHLFVLDHGTASSPALAPPETTKTLVIDHHFSGPQTFPESSEHVNASHSPPVATTSLLTYELCVPLFPAIKEPQLAWLATVGTHGDLGTSLTWSFPFPDMTEVFSAHGKKSINDAVSLLNAPRRTATYDVRSAWDVLLEADTPSAIQKAPGADRLRDARTEVNAEVSKWQAAAPKFSLDATVAVIRISSACQVHPVIATRWAGTLNSRKLRIVMCANEGYLPGKVNFSCRIARCARERVKAEREADSAKKTSDDETDDPDGGVDIISDLKAWASQHPSGDLLERMGTEFARGHVQASGGIVGVQEFEDLMSVLRVGEKPAKSANATKTSPGKKTIDAKQTNKLTSYFGKK